MQHFKELINNEKQFQKQFENEIIDSFKQPNPYRTQHIFGDFQNYVEFNHVGMDGGKFYIEKERLIKTLLVLKKKGLLFHSLVPQIKNKTIFFCDVDYLNENEKIERILVLTKKFLVKEYGVEFIDNFYITKSRTLHRFHIYFPDIILKKDRLNIFWDELNSIFLENNFKGQWIKGTKKAPIDTNVSGGIRYDGFCKYNKVRYEKNTEYLPYLTKNGSNFELDFTFYNNTYLLIDDQVECTKIKKKIPNSLRIDEDLTQSDYSQSLLNGDNSNSITTSCVSTLDYSELDGVSSTFDDDNQVIDQYLQTNSSNSRDLSGFGNYNETTDNLIKYDDKEDDSMDDGNHKTMENLKKQNDDDDEDEDDDIDINRNLRKFNDGNHDTMKNLKKRNEENYDKMEKLRKSGSNEIEEYFGTDAYDFLTEQYPFILSTIKGHRITKVGRMYKNTPRELSFIHLSKTRKDRTCPFTDRVHRKNNTYFMWIEKGGILQHRCFNAECKGRFMTVYTKDDVIYSQVVNDLDFDESDDEIEQDDLWTDIDVALVYLEMNPDLMYSMDVSVKGQEGMFFHFDKEKGIWKSDKGSHVLKKDLAKNFKKYIKKRWKKKISEAVNDEEKKKLVNQRSLLMRKLGDFRNIKNILDALKTLCIVQVELDKNPWYIVANNMVWDLKNNKKVIPRKDEYITNSMTTRFDIVPFDEEMDQYIHDMLFKKLFPNDQERETLLYYLSTTLNGKTLKKFLINLGMICFNL